MNLQSLKRISNLEDNLSIAQLNELMADLLHQLDPSIDHYHHQSWMDKLTSFNEEKANSIIDELYFHIAYLQQFVHSGGTFQDLISSKNESLFIKRSLSRRSLEYVDSSLESRFNDGDVIEVYDSTGVQICRSWSYFKNCSYSLTDILSFSWGELYSRPRLIEKDLLVKMTQLFTKDATTFDYNLPEYVVSEKFSKRKYSFLFSMKYASPVRDKNSKQIVAFVTTGELKKLFIDHSHDNTHFI